MEVLRVEAEAIPKLPLPHPCQRRKVVINANVIYFSEQLTVNATAEKLKNLISFDWYWQKWAQLTQKLASLTAIPLFENISSANSYSVI